ncbi:sulfite exporter TauE/SafE family protein [Cutibacterium avidum]|uniref:sulfite exporter TauE/SafE family protein n=1 Tax=Cutibacterium avidum TaxID=33010 RepID=UPI00280E5958|nr:sulfite exporter TauE/SafE family protein [Cutibacterium avidum]MDQ9044315.1 sulfite exporter TauE/SafE family protein [Cutibacterium avidum]
MMLPSLLVGLPTETPVATIVGTNKTAQVVGNLTAGVGYLRKQRPDWRMFLSAAGMAVIGAVIGARIVTYMSRAVYTPILLIVLVVIGIYTWRRPALGVSSHGEGGKHPLLVPIIGLFLGCYDGAIGPGVGTFWVLTYVAVGGYSFLKASGMAKICNTVTNLVTITTLAIHGHVWWHVAWPLVIANVVGGFIGARTAMKHGNGFVRTMFLIITSVLAVRMLVQLIWGV